MGKHSKFLADFHIHSNFSDGKLPIPEIIDLYGKRGFGAIAITDHIAEESKLIGKAAIRLGQVLNAKTFPLYKDILEREKVRAWNLYQMVVITGFELSKNSISNHRSAHILGLGVNHYISADKDPVDLAIDIKKQKAVAIAAHPVHTRRVEKQTYHLWDRRKELEDVFDAWEVASGPYLFDEVKQSNLPKIANSDLHHKKHFRSWKTVLHCKKDEQSILQAIRNQELSFEFYAQSA